VATSKPSFTRPGHQAVLDGIVGMQFAYQEQTLDQ
jgi:hypothetical protein